MNAHRTDGGDSVYTLDLNDPANESRNFIIALVSVIVAVVTSLASLFISLSGHDYSQELNNINTSLQNICSESTEKDSINEISVSANELLHK